jgi:hypothetical protein
MINKPSGENGAPDMRRIIVATILAVIAALTSLAATPAGTGPVLADVGCCRG